MGNTDSTKKIYLVGGAVRDTLLKLPIKDKDYVAVGFREEDFKHLPRVGKNFPVFLQKDGSQIALARREKKTQHGYNGFSVEVQRVSLYEDLKRRDLTINAIAFDEETQTYYDPFNGIKDLKNKILRHISSAFCEDPLRVLRIARLRAKLGKEWKIHKNTKILIQKMRNELLYLEKNRVYKEVENVLLRKNSHLFFESLFELGILDIIFPKIYTLTTQQENNLPHLKTFLCAMEMLKIMESTTKNTKHILILKFAALYCNLNNPKPNGTKIIASSLDIAIPNVIKKPLLLLIQNHTKICSLSQMSPKECIEFFDSYKKNSTLLELQIILLFSHKQRDMSLKISQQTLESSFLEVKATLLNAFRDLIDYSPKEWITQKGLATSLIKERILKEKIEILKKNSTFLTLQKCF